MVDIRCMAIHDITESKSLSDVDQVILGREYAVVDWVISGYQALTKRTTIVSMQSASRLTLSTCLKVWQAQVSISNASASQGCGSDKPEHDTLNNMFASELDEVYHRGLAFGDGVRPSKPRFPSTDLCGHNRGSWFPASPRKPPPGNPAIPLSPFGFAGHPSVTISPRQSATMFGRP